MEHLLKPISTLLDLLYSQVVGPVFSLIGRGLDELLIRPLQVLHTPLILQVMVVASLTGVLSLILRHSLGADDKEAVFLDKVAAQHRSREDLNLISDWKSRQTYAKLIDDDIDKEYNNYLAGRFARHGIVYLLPLFFSLFWLQQAIAPARILISLPENRFGIQGLSVTLVFLLTYCAVLLVFFRLRLRRLAVNRAGVKQEHMS